MKFFLQTILCFAFVATVFGQDYGRRRPKPAVKPNVFGPSPVVHKPPYTPAVDTFNPVFGPLGGGLASLRGGGRAQMPEEIRRIIGSTVLGNAIVGGAQGFPRHGGTRNDDGLLNGWGDDPNIPVIPAVSMWNDPLNGAAFPTDYMGQELVFDPVTGRYVVKGGSNVGHQVAKETHVAAKTGGIIAGGVPTSHNTVKAEHSIAKEATHIARHTMAGIPGAVSSVGVGAIGGIVRPVGHVGVDPVFHDINKQVAAQTGYPKRGSFGPNMAVEPFGHNIVKSNVHHGAVKTTGVIAAGRPLVSHGAVKSAGTINAGHVGVDHPGVIAHNIGKATLGADAMHGHNIARASADPVGVGFIDPTGMVASQINHEIVKSSGAVGVNPLAVGLDPFGQVASGEFIATDPVINHGIAKSSGRHLGISQLGTFNAGHVAVDPPQIIAHNIGKATLGADAMVGHNIAKASGPPVGVGFINPDGHIASQMGHDIAKASTGAAMDPFNTAGHDIAKASGGVPIGHARTVGTVGFGADPVHNVHKVGQSGIAGVGHDHLAASLGHGIAKQAASEAARAIDIGSRGGVSVRDPIALSAAQSLAEESIHVAGKTMDLASGTRFAPGMSIHGPRSMRVQHKPAKKPFPTITGYGRRTRI